MLSFSDLEDLFYNLKDPRYVPLQAKVVLVELLEEVLKLKSKKSSEDVIATFKSKIKNELKSEVSNEMKLKIGKLERLERENKDLQTKKDQAERLSRALKHTAQKENIELKNKLNIQIQQLQQEKKTLEAQNKIIEQSEKKTTRIATAIAVGLAVYIALEHITQLDMWLMISIAVVPALIATGIALKPNTQLNRTQELQGVANENAV